MTDLKRGTKITVILGVPRHATITLVLLLEGPIGTSWSTREYRRRERNPDRRQSTYPIKSRPAVDLPPDLEGVTWAKGWDGPESIALRAHHALDRSRE